MAAADLAKELLIPGTVLRSGDFLILHAFGRWHLLTWQSLNDVAHGIHTLHFMSQTEAEGFLKDFDAGTKVQHFEDISPSFAAEVGAKILPRAQDYLLLLEAGVMDMGAGMSTDTLGHVSYDAAKEKEWLEDIDQMMKEGGPGPYLRFMLSYRGIPVAPDFEALCKAAYAEGAGTEQRNALWSATFRLKEWNFIARGEFPEVHPYVCANAAVADGQYMLKAFTDADKLRAFATANHLTDPDGSVKFLSIPVSGFLGSLDEYRKQGVYGIHFNAQGAGFFGPLEKLPAMLTFLKNQGEL